MENRGPYGFKEKKSGETWMGICRFMVEPAELKNSNRSKKCRILQAMSVAIRWLTQHATKLAEQTIGKTKELEEATEAIDY